jgi:hypothetical protein
VSIEFLDVVEAIFKNRRPSSLTLEPKSAVIKAMLLRKCTTMWQTSLSFAWLPFVLNFWIANTAYPSTDEKVKPQEMIDTRSLDEMERSGLFEQLWGGKR